jgi:hypothetical protein
VRRDLDLDLGQVLVVTERQPDIGDADRGVRVAGDEQDRAVVGVRLADHGQHLVGAHDLVREGRAHGGHLDGVELPQPPVVVDVELREDRHAASQPAPALSDQPN